MTSLDNCYVTVFIAQTEQTQKDRESRGRESIFERDLESVSSFSRDQSPSHPCPEQASKKEISKRDNIVLE